MHVNTRDAPPLEIEVQDLHKSFGNTQVLRGVNLTIDRGELVAIVGSSGGGKTVLLKHLIGQLQPDAGRILLADHETDRSPLVNIATLDDAGMDRLRNHWAVVFQRNGLLSGTVGDDIALPLRWVKGLGDQDTRHQVREAINAVGLDPDRVLAMTREELSGGMAKCVAIARAVAMRPLLMFFDEPTTGLDPEHAKRIEQLIAEMHAHLEDGFCRTVLVITHDKELLYRLKPRIVMLKDGKVAFDGAYQAFACEKTLETMPYFELLRDMCKA